MFPLMGSHKTYLKHSTPEVLLIAAQILIGSSSLNMALKFLFAIVEWLFAASVLSQCGADFMGGHRKYPQIAAKRIGNSLYLITLDCK